MSTPHTPGPWSVRGQAGYAGHGVADSTGRSICSVPSNGTRPHAERNANVVLIAAAPLLLETLQYVVGRIPASDGQSISQAKAAIAKATT